nr:MAG TPA: hypothetical protein [Caudoviricetes sp.]
MMLRTEYLNSDRYTSITVFYGHKLITKGGNHTWLKI